MSYFYIRDIQYNKQQIAGLTIYNHSAALNKPNVLFKYFPNTIKDMNGVDRNFSKEALANNTVHLSAPSEFDDPYDCNVYVDYNEFALQRVRYYALLCGVNIKQEWDYAEVSRNLAMRIFMHISSGGKVASLFELDKSNELVRVHQEYFLISLEKELLQARLNPNADGEFYYKAINHVIDTEYNNMQKTANRFRVSCFAQSPYSMLMWSHYANNHQGFCIEYETPDYSKENENIYFNLFPVIYTDTRTSLTKLSLNWNATGSLSHSDIWDFYKYCLLSKSLDWKYQQEWRLISCDTLLTDQNYNCKFFKIKKVYLGNKMSAKDRLEIIDICKKQGIPYTGVTIASDQFNMSDCGILCEDCDRVKQYIQSNSSTV
ncbi:DUF2971 domain-containing protein [Ruminococcus flavefaciens]|uniref:DUF2971 family protein n=1 Tax=Ruminococcus flavefaciens TaxID=1265 RepID=A0A315XXX8_RUMFL|nr:DUF2971 domain-containing protein [Ruminococcus flavefaciens]PWJ10450.1 Protein of unknown function (DUF2971) [Ruminococcus flavefaciens]SSA51906.1 Protein of unknown function [Ruminococcus flavefaciens]